MFGAIQVKAPVALSLATCYQKSPRALRFYYIKLPSSSGGHARGGGRGRSLKFIYATVINEYAERSHDRADATSTP